MNATSLSNCPRCDRPLIRNHDDAECLVHGTIEIPMVAPDEAQRELQASDGKVRNRQERMPSPRWTNEERRIWRDWKEGDPVPPDLAQEETMNEPMSPQAMTTINGDQLATMSQQRIAAIDVDLGKLDRAAAKLREERAKMAKIVGFLSGGAKPEKRASSGGEGSVACADCGQTFGTSQGCSLHHKRIHGPGWDTTGNLKGNLKGSA